MQLHAIALGSNRRHGRHGAPADVIRAAAATLAADGMRVVALSPIVETAPIGLTGRRFANAAALIETSLAPAALLVHLKGIERAFGRRRGRRWDSRVLDLDILLWSGGGVDRRELTIPHPFLRRRRFVLDPLESIAPRWRVGARSVRQWRAILARRRPVRSA